jgi:phasin family protein
MMMSNPFAAADNQAGVDSLFGLVHQASEGLEQLCALNLQAIKASTAELSQFTQAALSAKNPADLMQLQTSALQAAPEKALAYVRHAKEIFDAATAGQRNAVDTQVADVQAKFLDAVNGALKNAPGSENTVALVKSAVAAANNAYEGLNKAAKQALDAVEANVTKATETAMQTSRRTAATLDA